MDAIIKRLREHRVNEMTKKDAKGAIIDALQEEYPTCKVEWNSYHNCVDVIDERGQVIFQCYLDRTSKETTNYKYERVDPSTVGPDDVIYKRVPAGKGVRYDYKADKSLVKSVSSTSTLGESTTGGTIFKTGDVCIYHFKEMSEDIPEETKQYYKDKDGCYCFVTSDDDYHGYIQIRFISDVAKNDNQSAECPPDELEKVGR